MSIDTRSMESFEPQEQEAIYHFYTVKRENSPQKSARKSVVTRVQPIQRLEEVTTGKIPYEKNIVLPPIPMKKLESPPAQSHDSLQSPPIPMTQLESSKVPSAIEFPPMPSQNQLRAAKNPTKEANLTWSNLCVKMPKKTKCCGFIKEKDTNPYDFNEAEKAKSAPRKNIVENACGFAKSRDVLAIMGASGAGKTTLLNALTMRNRGNFLIDGDVKVNGVKVKNFEEISSISGYVQQEDLFVGYLTVREHLFFQAMLRMKPGTSKEDRLKRIEEVIQELNLNKCQKNVIGLFGRKGISGGEKRRLAFASEIMTDPSLLFADEPTSGLDSFMAVSIMETMRELASKGKTIVCTIHQPSSEIFEMFDKLCLMVEGKIAYFGDIQGAKVFFEQLGYPVPTNYNPADFYIKKLAIAPNDREGSLEIIKKICDGYDNSEINAQKLATIKEIDGKKNDTTLNKEPHFKSNVFTQMRWLLWRNAKAIIREPFSFQVQIIQAFLVSLLFGAIYFQLKYDSEGIQNINGFIFLCLTNNGFSTMFFVVASFPLELPIFLREHQNGMYRVVSYYLSKIFIDLPTFILIPVIFMSIAYWMAGLNANVDRFFIAVLIVVLVVQCSLAFGTFLSAIAPSVNIALAFAGPVLVPLMIFSGFLLSFDAIPNYFVWLRYFSWFSYANENLLLNQWEGVGNMTNLDVTCEFTSSCFFTGDQLIDRNKWNRDNKILNYSLLSALIVFYRVITYIALVIRTYIQSV